jgi:hypothetical protein
MAAHQEIIDPGWGWNAHSSFPQAVRASEPSLPSQMPVDPHTAAVAGVGDIRTTAYQTFPPAWAAVSVPALAFTGQMLEIKVIALAR